MKSLSILILSAIILIFSNCIISQKNQATSELLKVKYKVNGVVQIHYPYCGGAYPPPHLENGRTGPYHNKVFYIVLEKDSSKTPVLKFTTNDSGRFEIELEKNVYAVFSEEKLYKFTDFCKIYSGDDNNLVSNGIPCLKKWYRTPDFVFDLTKDTSLIFTFYSSCFTGLNPCLSYRGPYPP